MSEPRRSVDVAGAESRETAHSGDTSDVEKGTPPAPEEAHSNDNKDNIDSNRPDVGGELYQPGTLKFWLIIMCNLLALFLVALDRTIVATAIPRITDDFHSLGDIGWYGSAYMLTVSAFQLIFGRVYRLYNMKWTFLLSVLFFEVGSVICAAAPSSAVFIAGRAVAGAASAGIFVGFILIIIPMVPLHKRPMFQSLFGMVFGITAVAGPLVGGAFTSGVSWRWCFWINLPIGAVSWVVMFFLWNPPKEQQKQQEKRKALSAAEQIKNLDPLGILFLVPSIVCLLLALQWGGSTYAWSDGRIIALFVLFGVLGLGFGLVETYMPDTATVPPKVVMQRSVFLAVWFIFFLAGSMLMVAFFLPVWFQTVKGVDPIQSGIDTIPLLLSMVVASFVSAVITQKLGYYVPSMLFSPMVMAVGNGLMGTFQPATGSPHWIAYQFVAGFGLGFGMQTGGLAIQTVLPRDLIPAGIAVNMFGQQLGGAIFTSVGQAILSNVLVSQLAGALPGLDAAAIVNEGATALLSVVPEADVPLVVSAYNYGCTRIFFAAMGLALASLLCAAGMEWKSIKKGKRGEAPKTETVSATEKEESVHETTSEGKETAPPKV